MATDYLSEGQPLLNTRNDLRTGLVNGDTGIVVNTKTGRKVVFSTQQQSFEPSALEDIEVAFATTIHKSQGSERRAQGRTRTGRSLRVVVTPSPIIN